MFTEDALIMQPGLFTVLVLGKAMGKWEKLWFRIGNKHGDFHRFSESMDGMGCTIFRHRLGHASWNDPWCGIIGDHTRFGTGVDQQKNHNVGIAMS